MSGRSVILVMVVMVLALTPPIDAGIRTESESTVKTPTNCDVMNIPHLRGYREPLHYNHQYHNNNNNINNTMMMMMMKEMVLEAEIVLTPPPSTEVNTVRLEVGTLDINNTPVGWIDFIRWPSRGIEDLRFSCLQDYVGRVATPWIITPARNTISIILKITEWDIKIYQEQEGDQQSLVADQQCPRGVDDFPFNELKLWCFDGGYCGQVLSPPTITEYTNVSTSPVVDIDVMVWKEQVTRLTFKDLPNQHWSIGLLYSSDGYNGVRVKMSHTPKNIMGQHMWLEVWCGGRLPDYTSVQQYKDTPSNTSPPRYYLVQVGIDWMRVTETTPGHNQTVQQHNCSRSLSLHPNLTITINCVGSDECGTVSQPCPTDIMQDVTDIEKDITDLEN